MRSIAENDFVRPPRVIFLPEKDLSRKILRAIAEFGVKEGKEKMLLRFALVGNRRVDEFFT
jgi:hypothetical protein